MPKHSDLLPARVRHGLVTWLLVGGFAAMVYIPSVLQLKIMAVKSPLGRRHGDHIK